VNARITLTAGVVVRRPIRRIIREYGLAYDEDKGWLDSHFVISGPAEKIIALRERVDVMLGGRWPTPTP